MTENEFTNHIIEIERLNEARTVVMNFGRHKANRREMGDEEATSSITLLRYLTRDYFSHIDALRVAVGLPPTTPVTSAEWNVS